MDRPPPTESSVVALLAERVLDAELAALVWLLVEARLPIVVAGRDPAVRRPLLASLLVFLPPDARVWRPEASGDDAARLLDAPPTTVVLGGDIGDGRDATPDATARVALRAVAVDLQLAVSVDADRLEDVFERLRRQPLALSDDELSRLGVVLVARTVRRDSPGAAADAGRRVVAAHYVRPVARDEHGHIQRLPPAVLAAREPRHDALEHFAWGVLPELAARTGQRAGDLEVEQRRRAEFLADLERAGTRAPEAVALAIAGYRDAHSRRPA